MHLLIFLLFTILSAQTNALEQNLLPRLAKLTKFETVLEERLDNSVQENSDLYPIKITKEEQAYLLEKTTLTMCVDPDWMPYEKIENGVHKGMSAEFVRLIEAKLKIPIVLLPSSTWPESLEFAKQRQCDFISLIMATPERMKFLDFSDPYFSFPLVIATRYEQTFINDIGSVVDKKLGIQKGYAYVELLNLQYPSINLIEVDSLDDGLQKVMNHELFGMIGSLPSVSYAFQQNSISKLMISGKLAQIWHLGFGIRNDEPLLSSILNKVIKQLNKDEVKDITNQWMSIKYQQKIDYGMLIKGLTVLTVLFCIFLYYHFQLKKYNKRLKRLSVTDSLTGVNNRIELDRQLDKCIFIYKRYQNPFSIILLDIDLFKRINDEFGHLIGDYAITVVAQLLNDNIRSVDTLGRWGGEEFLIVCPDQTLDGAALLAEKLRHKIDNYCFDHFSNLSCSFGVSTFTLNDDVDKIVDRADDALYSAKKGGRNKVCAG